MTAFESHSTMSFLNSRVQAMLRPLYFLFSGNESTLLFSVEGFLYFLDHLDFQNRIGGPRIALLMDFFVPLSPELPAGCSKHVHPNEIMLPVKIFFQVHRNPFIKVCSKKSRDFIHFDELSPDDRNLRAVSHGVKGVFNSLSTQLAVTIPTKDSHLPLICEDFLEGTSSQAFCRWRQRSTENSPSSEYFQPIPSSPSSLFGVGTEKIFSATSSGRSSIPSTRLSSQTGLVVRGSNRGDTSFVDAHEYGGLTRSYLPRFSAN
ncbi:hypothetical protein PIB30_031838 [Stylosanthes scabra]|uniref:Uncharacterized protein n=1 Tax=Stylosanthes scabra TaxID=79078 RepID=A0ABU6SBZ5_9FABA|nr:hypothetical protein [Stylosanthes scabra]